MRRRQFTAIASTLLLAPWHVALAQRATIPFIGYLSAGPPNEREQMVDVFRKGLGEGGFVDGKDVAIEFRWAEGRSERLQRLAEDLVKRKVAVIVTSGGSPSALAAKAATQTIPIVFITATDPVSIGLVASLGRPGGNLTGVASAPGSLEAKRLETMRDLLPGATTFAFLVNPKSAAAVDASIKQVNAAGAATKTRIQVVQASSAREIEAAFAELKKVRAQAVLVANDGLFTTQRELLIELADRYRIPAIYHRREFAAEGGLISYGPDYGDGYRQMGLLAARLLKGAKPADLPVIQASKFELVVNAKTAKKLGITLSRDFLSRVDEMIQ